MSNAERQGDDEYAMMYRWGTTAVEKTSRSVEADACCRVDLTGRSDNTGYIHQPGTGRFQAS